MIAVEGIVVLAFSIDISLIKKKRKSAVSCGDKMTYISNSRQLETVLPQEIQVPYRSKSRLRTYSLKSDQYFPLSPR
jgi:hypothetical protein